MRKQISLVLCLFLGLSSTAAAYTIGLYADPAGVSCDLPTEFAVPNNWYVVAKLEAGEDISGFEFQITGLSPNIIPIAEIFEADVLWVGSGANVFSGGGAGAFLSCRSESTVLIATIQVLPVVPAEVGTLQVEAWGSQALACDGAPDVASCDATLYCADGGQAYYGQAGCIDVVDESFVFEDGFESGDTTSWSTVVGVPGLASFGPLGWLEARN